MLANTWNLHTPNVIVLRHFPLSFVFVILTLPHKLNSGNRTQTQQDINHDCACDSPWKFHHGSLTRTLNAWLDSQVKGNITGQTGILWSWAGTRWQDGYFYSDIGLGGHSHTGRAVFIFPDLRSGLKGKFEKGRLVQGQSVKIVGLRCKGGVVELLFDDYNSTCYNSRGRAWYEGEREPFEKRYVFVSKSREEKAGEGLFLKRRVAQGSLVAYYSGQERLRQEVVASAMSLREREEALAYVFGLGRASPQEWNLREDLVLDVPQEHREQYMVTSGHKANHKFEENNGVLVTAFHPLLGKVGAVLVIKDLEAGDEVTLDYGYDLDSCPKWYKELWLQNQAKKRELLQEDWNEFLLDLGVEDYF